TFSAVFVLAACGNANNNNDPNNNNGADSNRNGEGGSDDVLAIVTTFTLIEDMVNQMGGDLVETHNLVPIGTDPHEYEPLPEDIKAATDADLIIYNGFNLEGDEEDGWIVKLADSINKDFDEFYELMK